MDLLWRFCSSDRYVVCLALAIVALVCLRHPGRAWLSLVCFRDRHGHLLRRARARARTRRPRQGGIHADLRIKLPPGFGMRHERRGGGSRSAGARGLAGGVLPLATCCSSRPVPPRAAPKLPLARRRPCRERGEKPPYGFTGYGCIRARHTHTGIRVQRCPERTIFPFRGRYGRSSYQCAQLQLQRLLAPMAPGSGGVTRGELLL